MIIWDTEFTSWEGCNENGWDESNEEYKELIQIGAVKVDNKTYSIIDTLDVLVKPRINSQLSDYIQDLTSISQESVERNGLDFVKAVKEFEDFCGDHDRYSWGNDLDILLYNIDLYDCDIEVTDENKYNDIRQLFRDLNVPVDEYTSGTVYKHFNLGFSINVHYALDDSLSMVLALQSAKNSP